MFVIMLVTLYTSRIVLRNLGIEDYGIYNVVAGAVAMFGFMNSAMSMATQRFLNFYMVKNDITILRKVFVMSVNIHIIIALIVIILAETVGKWLIDTQLNIPFERIDAAKYVFQFAILSFCLSVLQVPYNSVILAYERMNVYAFISIFEALLKLSIAFLIAVGGYDKLIFYGFLLVLSHIIILLIYFFVVFCSYKGIRYKFLWDNIIFKEIAGFSGWNLLGQIAQILSNQGVNMVANVFCGVIVNASIGITNQVNTALLQFSQNFQSAFRPQIVKSYSVGDKSGMENLVYQASKFSFFLIFIISVPIIYNIDAILNLWLSDVPVYSSIFCKLLIWYSYVEIIGLPLVIAILASGYNRNYQLLASIVIALNVLLVYFFLKSKASPESIFYVKILVSIFLLCVRVFYVKKQLLFSTLGFMRSVLFPIICVVVIVQLVQYILTSFAEFNKFLITCILILVSVLSIVQFGIDKNEKKIILSLFSKYNKK